MLPKLYILEKAPMIVRVYIRKQGEESQYLNFCETTQFDVVNFIKEVIEEQKLSIFETGKVTACDVRMWHDNKFVGKSQCVSFKGLSPKQLYDLILYKLK